MKKTKILFIAVTFMVCGFIFGACANTSIADQVHPLKIWKENRNGQMETWKVIDDDTGVNYIVIAPNFSDRGGNEYDGVCITPRLNADGSLYTSK